MPRRKNAPPKVYSLAKMPRVDAHVHIRDLEGVPKMLRTLTRAGIDLCIDLSGTAEKVARADEIHRRWKGRLLIAPASWRLPRVVWWSDADLAAFKAAGCAGTKIGRKYRRGLTRKPVIAKIRKQGELGLPVIGLHIADPPVPGWWEPPFWDCIYDAEKLIAACPGTTFIMAHGFWLMNDDKGLDVLSRFFERYENLNVDLSAVFQWWDPPEPTYAKLREFVNTWRERLLYGTDGNPNYSKLRHYEDSYRVLETRGEGLQGFFTSPGGRKTYIKGLGLSAETLNYIYWWNAARLIPRVRESLLAMGYEA